MRYHEFEDRELRDRVLKQVLDITDPMTITRASKILKVTWRTVKSWERQLKNGDNIMTYRPKTRGAKASKANEAEYLKVAQMEKDAPTDCVPRSSVAIDECRGLGLGSSGEGVSVSGDVHIASNSMDSTGCEIESGEFMDEIIANPSNEPWYVIKPNSLNEKLEPTSLVLTYEDGTSHEYGHRRTQQNPNEYVVVYYQCISCRNLCAKEPSEDGCPNKRSTLKFSNGKIQFSSEEHHSQCISTPKWTRLAIEISREGKLQVKEKKKKPKRAWLDDVKLALNMGEQEGLSAKELDLLSCSFGTWPNSSYIKFGRMEEGKIPPPISDPYSDLGELGKTITSILMSADLRMTLGFLFVHL